MANDQDGGGLGVPPLEAPDNRRGIASDCEGVAYFEAGIGVKDLGDDLGRAEGARERARQKDIELDLQPAQGLGDGPNLPFALSGQWPQAVAGEAGGDRLVRRPWLRSRP